MHIFWIALLVGGIFFMIKYSWYVVDHVVIVTGTLMVNLFMGYCPFTRWEEKYRKKYDPNAFYYPNSFVITYLKRFFNINMTPGQANTMMVAIKVVSYGVSVLVLTKVI